MAEDGVIGGWIDHPAGVRLQELTYDLLVLSRIEGTGGVDEVSTGLDPGGGAVDQVLLQGD